MQAGSILESGKSPEGVWSSGVNTESSREVRNMESPYTECSESNGKKLKKMGSEIFILKTPEVHISTSIALITSKIIAIIFYAQFGSQKKMWSFF
jgi:hypothetical protein